VLCSVAWSNGTHAYAFSIFHFFLQFLGGKEEDMDAFIVKKID
jgi:hypothetical protein